MAFPMRALCAATLGFGTVVSLAGCSISTAPTPPPPVVVQTAPAPATGTVVTPGSAVVVQQPRY